MDHGESRNYTAMHLLCAFPLVHSHSDIRFSVIDFGRIYAPHTQSFARPIYNTHIAGQYPPAESFGSLSINI
jgi:hypothetical protein